MRASTIAYSNGEWTGAGDDSAGLVLWVGAPKVAADPAVFAALKRRYPQALIAGCSTNGEILDGDTLDGGAVAAALSFDKVRLRAVERPLAGADPGEVGRDLVGQLAGEDLKAVCLLIAASLDPGPFAAPLVLAGAAAALPPGVTIFGGGAGDGTQLDTPAAGLDRAGRADHAVAIGFYGSALQVGFGVGTGWDPLGPVRRVTRSQGPVIYEFDGQPALDLYLRYMGVEADQFRTTTARFPFTFWTEDGGEDMVRPVGRIDEAGRGLVVIQDIPVGASAQMMHCAFDRLIDAGAAAARGAVQAAGTGAGFAFVTSCLGRRAAMGQYIADESYALAEELGGLPMIGFYGYGEYGQHKRTGRAVIHTDSVAVTVLGEAA